MSLSQASIVRTAQVWPKWLPKAVVQAESRIIAPQTALSTSRTPLPPAVFSASFRSLLSQPADSPPTCWASKASPFSFLSQQQVRTISSSARRSRVTPPPPAAPTKPPHLESNLAQSSQSPIWIAPSDVSTRPVTVVGAGVLGRRLAMMWASTGRPVNLYDLSPKALESAAVYIADNLGSFCASHNTHPGHVHLTTDLIDATTNAWMVIEAVPEDLEVKVSVLGRLDRITRKDCLLTTNSSSYSSRELSSEVAGRYRLLNTLYYIPPENVSVELMSCGYTAPEIFKFLKGEMEQVGLAPKIAGSESMGMILPRLWAAMKRETLCMLQEGVAKPEDVDELFRDFFNAKKGPCEKMDEIGLDTVAAVEKHYLSDAQVRLLGSDHLRWLEENYVEKGKLGKKTGEGLIMKKIQKPKVTKDEKSGQEVWKEHSVDLSGL
ncbi:hypothetical protein BGZ60DRAFT_412304 [Tricladium varicosporioides]|nr:hypothetical protein BGZ60DRAFT_412304 [Hymenoscyphus varicosporioides]